jgi:hypothetical protein
LGDKTLCLRTQGLSIGKDGGVQTVLRCTVHESDSELPVIKVTPVGKNRFSQLKARDVPPRTGSHTASN